MSAVTFGSSQLQNIDDDSLCNLTITCQHLFFSNQNELRILSFPYNFRLIRKFKVFFFLSILYFTGGLSNILHFCPDSHLCSRTFALLAAHGIVVLFCYLLFNIILNENHCILKFLRRVTSMTLNLKLCNMNNYWMKERWKETMLWRMEGYNGCFLILRLTYKNGIGEIRFILCTLEGRTRQSLL